MSVEPQPAVNQPVVNQPVQVRTATVVANEDAGAYRRLVLDAPAIAERARPGQFVALAVGEEPTSTLLRRAFSIHYAGGGAASGIDTAGGGAASGIDTAGGGAASGIDTAGGGAASGIDTAGGGAASGIDTAGGGAVEIVVAAHGVGSAWVTRRRPGDVVDVVGPLGRPFPEPAGTGATRAVLVGGGYGSSPMPWFAQELLARGVDVDVVVGAASAARLFGVEEAAKVVGADRVHVTTDDGSAGTRGRVTDVLGPLLAAGTQVYACGPMVMLRAVTAAAAEHGATAWCTVEEAMACGIGVCMTCVMPVRGADGVTRMTRSCTEGPTFAGDAVRWDHVCAGPGGRGSAVPADCLGAPKPQGGH